MLPVAFLGCGGTYEHNVKIQGLEQPAKEVSEGMQKFDPWRIEGRADAEKRAATAEQQVAELQEVNERLRKGMGGHEGDKLPGQLKQPNGSSPPKFFLSATVGGTGGRPFSDGQPERAKLTGIRIRAGGRIDSIQLISDNVHGEKHGKDGGILTEITSESDECISSISGRAGGRIDKLTIHTNKRELSFGKNGGAPFTLEPPKGYEIIGFFGRCDAEVDALGIIARERLQEGGGNH